MADAKKRGPGRPRNAKPKVTEKNQNTFVAVQEVSDPEAPKAMNLGGWITPKAARIQVHLMPEDGYTKENGYTVSVKLGDCPQLHFRRGVEVIVPVDVLSVLDDSEVEYPAEGVIESAKGEEKMRGTVKKSRFPYTLYEILPWEAWLKYREEQKGKPLFKPKE